VHKYALELANRIAARRPEKYTTLAGATNRVGRLFIDCLRNGRGYTAVGAYSPRARPGLPFSAPVTWDDLKRRISPDAFSVGLSQSAVSTRLASL
jgi:bifunctional non-homologous end joining protein LigD